MWCVWLGLGAVIWAAGIFGIARAGEDVCLHETSAHGYGGYSQSADLWPPRLTCTLRSPDDPADPELMTVEQPLRAWAPLVWGAGMPLLWVGGGLLVHRGRTDRAATP